MKSCIIIPARLNSNRLPGKLLLKINNLSLIENVYNNCCKTKNTDVYIATDNLKIKRECLKFTENIIITNSLHNSGTDRVAEAAEKLKIYETIINEALTYKYGGGCGHDLSVLRPSGKAINGTKKIVDWPSLTLVTSPQVVGSN